MKALRTQTLHGAIRRRDSVELGCGTNRGVAINCRRENIFTDTYSRTRASYGAATIDALRLRHRIIENIPDAVLCPRSQEDLEQIVRYCHEHHIPLYVNGGGSSVTRGKEAIKGGISLDMSAHLNKVVAFNEATRQ